MNYNPYDLVEINLNGMRTHARPYEFDSEVKNQHDMTNEHGKPVKPTKLSLACPQCGAGLNIDVRYGENMNPPLPVLNFCCLDFYPECPNAERVTPTKLDVDPFVNPLESGRVKMEDLDPILQSGKLESKGTVADRMKKAKKSSGKASSKKGASKSQSKSKNAKKAKEDTSSGSKEVLVRDDRLDGDLMNLLDSDEIADLQEKDD